MVKNLRASRFEKKMTSMITSNTTNSSTVNRSTSANSSTRWGIW